MTAAPEFSTYRPASGVAVRTVGEETVIVDLDDEQYFSLNDTGTVVWSAVSTGRTMAVAAEALVEKFEVTREQANGDVKELVEVLVENGLLVPAG